MNKKSFLIILICIVISLISYNVFIKNNIVNNEIKPLEIKKELITLPNDIEYKKSIIEKSKNKNYKIENLDALVGPNELIAFIKENKENPETYTPSPYNIKNGFYQANLHCHSTNSDGVASVEFLLTQADEFAKKNLNGKPMYIAITDHNTVLGAQKIIEVLQKNPNKYKHVKVVTGIEIFTTYTSSFSDKPVDIHVLSWCINPYDKFLNKEFYKKNLKDKWNRTFPDRDFEEVISMMSEYGLVGIAHTARYLEHLKTEQQKKYIKKLFEDYKNKNKNNCWFIEGYYQSYKASMQNFDKNTEVLIENINKEAKQSNINLTGSTDVHGYSILSFR